MGIGGWEILLSAGATFYKPCTIPQFLFSSHSYLNASIGFSNAAFPRRPQPKHNTDHRGEQRKANNTDCNDTLVAQPCDNRHADGDTPSERNACQVPPSRLITKRFGQELRENVRAAELPRLSVIQSRVCAPVTDTSMIFMIPIPPTTKEMTAMEERSTAMVWLVDVSASRNSARLRMVTRLRLFDGGICASCTSLP